MPESQDPKGNQPESGIPLWYIGGSDKSSPINRLHDQLALVTQQIEPNKLGKVKYEGIHWDALAGSATIPKGSKVQVVGRQGLTLIVAHFEVFKLTHPDEDHLPIGQKTLEKLRQIFSNENERASLEIDINIPADLPPEKVRELVQQAALAADAVHRSHGGSGLEIDTLEVFEDSRVPGGSRQ